MNTISLIIIELFMLSISSLFHFAAFQQVVNFFQVVKLMCMEFLVICPYFNVCRICTGIPLFHSCYGSLSVSPSVSLSFFVFSFFRGLSILKIFPKHQLLVSLIFSVTYALYFIDLSYLLFPSLCLLLFFQFLKMKVWITYLRSFSFSNISIQLLAVIQLNSTAFAMLYSHFCLVHNIF